ncbi:DUF1697 domain-containing protein [Microcella sp.]|uniref:DUF1697 domain-containing protein n=1 Tax=Microcella sp. TaxID=1913979 RepID=UPI00299F7EFE|nr:DUF1697 domain-containing protein [Microcella sp.]MDX2026772.1 DUF1697 domain-containing protein [Microcella sp.]
MLGPEPHVALLRNVNVGQRGHPSTDDLLSAFAAAGAPDALSFQSNGTIVYTARAAEAESLAQDAVAALARAAGHEREVVTASLASLRPLVDEHGSALDARRRELTLHGGPALEPDSVALLEAERRAHCTVLDSAPGWVVTLNLRDRQSNGTPLVEHVLGIPATSRGLPTLARLFEKLDASQLA